MGYFVICLQIFAFSVISCDCLYIYVIFLSLFSVIFWDLFIDICLQSDICVICFQISARRVIPMHHVMRNMNVIVTRDTVETEKYVNVSARRSIWEYREIFGSIERYLEVLRSIWKYWLLRSIEKYMEVLRSIWKY